MTISQLQTSSGMFTIAACDQRSSLAKILGANPEVEAGKTILEEVKSLFVGTFSPLCSSILVDPEFGLPSVEKKSSDCGLLLSLERSSYSLEDPENMPLLYDRWGVSEIAHHDAAVKLLLSYHPQSIHAQQKQQFVQDIFEQAKKEQTPLLLEIILHPLNGDKESLMQNFVSLQLQAVQDFTSRCDVLKLEFPLGEREVFDDVVVAQRCQALSETSSVPWILLSHGMGYERFLSAVEIAVQRGARGFAVGRAVWKEIGEYATWEEQEEFVRTVAKQRMQTLVNVVDAAQ